jgi:hypothetical protein
MQNRTKVVLGTAVTIATLIGAGVAYAQIPSGGVITACYSKAGGAVRVIDPATAKCQAWETKLTWNQQGQPGTPGKDGTDGVDGTNGADGVSGYTKVGTTFDLDPQTAKQVEVLCPTGTRPIGGGGHDGNIFDQKGLGYVRQAYIAESDVNDSGTGWAVTAVNNFSQPAEFSIDVICAAA